MSIKDFFSAGPGRAFVIIALVVCAASFYVGRGMGYDTGHAVASMSARSSAEANYQEGYDAGKEEGHDAGYKEGVQATRENYEAKLDAEYDKGYNKGLEDGRIEAYNSMAGIEAEDSYLANEPGYTQPADSGEIDPNTTTVWVIGSGTKYHTWNCPERQEHGGTNVSLAQAISMGKGPCAKCDPPVYNP